MAIQIPNPGTGNGATGDNEYVLWSKVKDNFSDQTNAASRVIGIGGSNIPTGTDTYKSSYTHRDGYYSPSAGTDANTLTDVGRYLISSANTNMPPVNDFLMVEVARNYTDDTFTQRAFGYTYPTFAVRAFRTTWSEWAIFYSTANTTTDSNGFIKAASPIAKVFADKLELNTDAENQNVTYKRNGIGDYTITTVSGLSTDGWYIELPKDMNGNPKVAVTLSEVDGVISLKSYKRIFSMETFTFEPDLDSPLDIPDTRWIDLRLNEIPVEYEDDIQLEEVDLDK